MHFHKLLVTKIVSTMFLLITEIKYRLYNSVILLLCELRFGKELRMSLVQAAAPSRISYEIRPGCSGLYTVWSWKSQKIDTAQPLWTIYFIADCPCGEVVSSYIGSEPLCFQFTWLIFLQWRSGLPPSSSWPPPGYQEAAVRCSQSPLFPYWTSPVPLHSVTAPDPSPPWWPAIEHASS